MMQNVPQELLDIYAQLVQNAPSPDHARSHLMNLLIDAETIAKAVQDIVNQARQAGVARNGQ